MLFDARPWQIGAPRLAHLAWLLVLARHARSRSCHFSWGVLQSPERELRESTEPGDIRWLMAARTRAPFDAEMIDGWALRLGPAGSHEERWVVTHARDDRTAARSVVAVFDWLRSVLKRRPRSRSSSAAASGSARAPEPSLLTQCLRVFFARLQRFIGLQRLLGRRHARYLAELIETLSGGDVREGLRRAIALRSMKEIIERTRSRDMSWRLPAARSQLAISPVRVRATSGLTLVNDLFARMQALYRATFQRLDAQQRYEEAAFVLAELLQSDEEAVAYLEHNGQHRRAAELAEARGCAPGLVVRAWFLADDRERALRIARERGAFHDAITRLERTHAPEARQLRLLWADALAASGAYADAVALASAARPNQARTPTA